MLRFVCTACCFIFLLGGAAAAELTLINRAQFQERMISLAAQLEISPEEAQSLRGSRDFAALTAPHWYLDAEAERSYLIQRFRARDGILQHLDVQPPLAIQHFREQLRQPRNLSLKDLVLANRIISLLEVELREHLLREAGDSSERP